METPKCTKKHPERILELVKDLDSTQVDDGRRHRCALGGYEKGFADGLAEAERRQKSRSSQTSN